MIGSGPSSKSLIVLTLSAMMLDCNVAFCQERGVGVEPAASPRASEGRSFALVIGINGYTNFAPLRFCAQDATELAKTLTANCGYQPGNVFLMVDGERSFKDQPTRANILATVRRVALLCDKKDTLFVFFSGHGTSHGDKGYLVPIDAADDTPDSLVSLSDLRGIMHESKAAWRVLILDACHSGTEKDSSGTAMDAAFESSLKSEGEGILTLASCKASEKSRESDAYGHGLFTFWLIKGLAGSADNEEAGNRDGLVESDELFKFVYERVRRDAVRNFSADQNPFWTGSGAGRLFLARHSRDTLGGSQHAGDESGRSDETLVKVSEDGTTLTVSLSTALASSSLDDTLKAKRDLRTKAEIALKKELRARGVNDPMSLIRGWKEGELEVGENKLSGSYSVKLK